MKEFMLMALMKLKNMIMSKIKGSIKFCETCIFGSYVYGIASSREIKDNGVIINVAKFSKKAAKAGMKTE